MGNSDAPSRITTRRGVLPSQGRLALIPSSRLDAAFVGNVITPRVQAWLSRYSSAALAKRVIRNMEEESRIAVLAEDPHRLVLFLLGLIVSVIWLVAVSSLFAGLMYFLGWYQQSQLLQGTAAFLLICVGVMTAKLCADAMGVIHKVRAKKDWR